MDPLYTKAGGHTKYRWKDMVAKDWFELPINLQEVAQKRACVESQNALRVTEPTE